MQKYEQRKNDRLFNLVYAAFQDRNSLLASLTSSDAESDFEMALEVAVECRDIVRMDINMRLGIFHPSNHCKLLDSLSEQNLISERDKRSQDVTAT